MNYYRSFKAPSKFAQQYLFFSDGMGHLKSEKFLIDRENFNNNLVMYVLSGKLHVEQNGYHHILTSDQGIIMKLKDKHKYYTDRKDICEILWLHFNGGQSEIFMNYLEQNCAMPLVFKQEQVKELIKHCLILSNKKNSGLEFLISETIYSILLSIISIVYKKKECVDINAKTEFMSKCNNYIDNNICNKITLEDFAKQFNISKYHFCKVFKKYFHTTPIQYILLKKIEFSKYLLNYTSDSISNIAVTLGFVDQSHFSKTFKKFENISPYEFRNMRKL